jgi:hypothetical protein
MHGSAIAMHDFGIICILVHLRGSAPRTSRLSAGRSAAELKVGALVRPPGAAPGAFSMSVSFHCLVGSGRLELPKPRFLKPQSVPVPYKATIPKLVPTAGPESARVCLQNSCSPSELRRPNLQTPASLPAIENCSLPETTVCRSTKGDQYRISGPSYVLAGTAILNSIRVMQRFAACGCPPASIG